MPYVRQHINEYLCHEKVDLWEDGFPGCLITIDKRAFSKQWDRFQVISKVGTVSTTVKPGVNHYNFNVLYRKYFESHIDDIPSHRKRSCAAAGYSGYIVVDDGRLWCIKFARWINPTYEIDGYVGVNVMHDDGKRRNNQHLHRIVGLSWHPNPDNKPVVNHIDHDKWHFHKDNLEHLTHKENNDRAHNHGVVKYPKLTNEMVRRICLRLTKGMRPCDIADELEVAANKVSSIKHRRSFCTISCDYHW